MSSLFIKDLCYGNYQPKDTIEKNPDVKTLLTKLTDLKNRVKGKLGENDTALLAELSLTIDALLDEYSCASYEEGIHFAANFFMSALSFQKIEEEQ